jgi:STE24 endopeptidase
MPFAFAFVILAVLVVADSVPKTPLETPWLWLAAVILVAALVPATALMVARWTLNRLEGEKPRSETLRRFAQLRAGHMVLWTAASLLSVSLLGWARWVRFHSGTPHLVLLEETLLLLPVLGQLLASWAFFYDVERRVRCAPAPGDTSLSDVPSFLSRSGYVGFLSRFYLGIFLVPLFVALVFGELIQWLRPELWDDARQWPLLMLPMLGLMAAYPLVLRVVWLARPLNREPLRHQLELMSERAGYRLRDILVWDTGLMVVNAAVAGLLPRLRYVFLSDGLVRYLNDAQLQAVFRHELGHIRHRHLMLRILAMFIPLSLFLLVRGMFTGSRLAAWQESLLGPFSGEVLGAIGVVVLALYLIFVFGPFSRLLEYQADLYACRAELFAVEAWEGIPREEVPRPAQTGCLSAEAVDVFSSALRRLELLSGSRNRRSSMQHASVALRVRFLQQMAADPPGYERFQRRMRLCGSLVVGLSLGGLIWHALQSDLVTGLF